MAVREDLAPVEQAAPALLGVGCSATSKRWVQRPADEALAQTLARILDAPEALGRVLAGRSVTTDTAEDFLAPTLKTFFPDPSSFIDMDKAAGLLCDALQDGRKVAVFADYDVDGASSAAQLIRYFRACGAEMDFYVPDRIEEGYGPSAPAFQELQRRGAEIVVTVDCGAMAHEPIQAANALGLTVVVLDHHQMTKAPPEAFAVVNPNRADCPSGCGHLAAAGVTFVLLAALNREGRRRGMFEDGEPDIIKLLDLAALGTICDVVPLVGVNRAIAAQGLKVMGEQKNPGLAALTLTAQAQGPATTYSAGFVYGPRINAGGRIGRADLGARLLSTDDPATAAEIAQELDALNRERREVEQGVLDAAVAQLEADPELEARSVITVAGEGWHPGVIGVVAGRLKERYGRPTIVIGLPLEGAGGYGKGSGRSIIGVDLGGAIAAARSAGLLVEGGGHAMAAGLTIEPDRVSEAAAFLDAHVKALNVSMVRELDVDAVVSAAGANRALAEIIGRAGPFGAGNPEPVFAIPDLSVRGAREVGKGHLKVTLEDAGGARVDAIAFRAADTGLDALLGVPGARVHICAKIGISKGRYLDVRIEDAAEA